MHNIAKLSNDKSMMYHKITNREENHNGYQYKDRLNILQELFAEQNMAYRCSLLSGRTFPPCSCE